MADGAVLVIRAWLEPDDTMRIRARLLGLREPEVAGGIVVQGADQVLDAVRLWLDDLVAGTGAT
jgi:hypothetical protein